MTDRDPLRLRIKLPSGDWMGPGKADLMQGIAETGSIAAAGKRLGMSYKRAWSLVEVLNAMFREPVVLASRGGAGHGGASLTPEGEAVLSLYRAAQAKAAVAAGEEVATIVGWSVAK
jgi:molybdate transport system regulatory protein